MLDSIDKRLLKEVADLHEIPQGAYNIRKNGEKYSRNTTANIDIVTKEDKPGIDIIIKPGTKNESVHIPVILSQSMEDVVYNTFEVGADSDVTIVAGCGIHNSTAKDSGHDGIHEFFIRRGAKVKYVEKHFGEGDGTGKRVLNPTTIINVEENATAELELVQIKGVDSTKRDTVVTLQKNARLIVSERLLTYQEQFAESTITVELIGDGSTAQVISRSVAQNDSKQVFHLNMRGHCECRGHIQCDSIIMHNAQVSAIPEISALSEGAELVHEAAIGRIASEQLTKLMCLGLTEVEAEETILHGFLK
ncbi:MAG: SufD family Fe-S cluster assembly protein [Oscillospiraceae bacterium]|jgi:Fe-S cluster assembly scaffold protein SufB|nr:SufD family Fe-S cluster assembly protein [Oscillospiraceae bacterium]